MTPAEFKTKWAKFSGKESSAYQEHFTDLCRMLRVPTPNAADPTGNDSFCFQKHVVKDAELLSMAGPDKEEKPRKRGFADVWKRSFFGWEYKGLHKDLEEAYKQLLQYREALLNPPLLVVCDFDRYIIKTNFTNTVQDTHEFTNDQIDRPENLRLLRAAFTDPDFLKPQRTPADVTEKLAIAIAEVAKSLQKREADELADAKTRAEMNFAQRKNLRIARFLNRIVFCFFAEDTGLLPRKLFTELLKAGFDDLHHLAETMETLFAVMARGGAFGKDKIRHFNGHLFEDSTVFELTADELRLLATAGETDWQFIQPSIMGTLFERALEPEQRAQLGAHYTSEADIKTLVEPVLMAPLRREWATLKGELAAAYAKGRGTPAQREKITAFQKRLATTTVLDPACGSGNFLYVALQLLLGLEKELFTHAVQLGFRFDLAVGVQQLRALEINPYAFELAQVSVQIGFLQWRRDNGFDNDRSPVLQNLDGFQNEDALLVPHFRSKAKTLKEAQTGEHAGETSFKFYTERAWPECDVLVGNPPFIGNKRLRSELGDEYTKAVFDTFGDRLPATSDFCCYWLEKARDLVERGRCRRAGMLATTGSKQISSRAAFERIKKTGKIFFGISDRDWFDAGTAIRICMVGFAGLDATDKPNLDGKEVVKINADLTGGLDLTGKRPLRANKGVCFMGTTKVGDFDIEEHDALELLTSPNAVGKPNSDVMRLFRNGSDLVRADSRRWVIDFGVATPFEIAAGYEGPISHLEKFVRPFRARNNRAHYREKWWIHAEPRPGFRAATAHLPRYIGTARVAKHRLFVWQDAPVLPDSKVIAIGFADDFHFGLLQSHLHEVWTLATCGWHGIGNDATYNPTECFETFPFPFHDDLEELDNAVAALDAAKHYAHIVLREEPTPYRVDSSRCAEAPSGPSGGNQSLVTSAATRDEQRSAIAAAAKELNDLRERWLNPPEWTETRYLEFPGSIDGPWARYLVPSSLNYQLSTGLVRYPRVEPRDADCAAKLKKRTLTNLYNERPAWLDLAHQRLDAAVAAAYGWPADLSDEQILERLLALNLERAAEEAKTARAKPPKTSRAKAEDELI